MFRFVTFGICFLLGLFVGKRVVTEYADYVCISGFSSLLSGSDERGAVKVRSLRAENSVTIVL